MEEINNIDEQPIIPVEEQDVEEQTPETVDPDIIPEEPEVITEPEPIPDPWDETPWNEDDPTPVDVTYIKDGQFVPLTMRINPATSHVGTTLSDYHAGAWVELSEEQKSFHEENPTATPEEAFNMELIPVPEPEEPEYAPNYNAQVFMFARMTINETPLTDMQALAVKDLYPEWASFIGQPLAAGKRVLHEERLYNVRQDVAVVQEHQPPSVDTASLYEEINEQNTGTIDDPIPYNGNMALENGKYYSQFAVTYKCIRDTGNPVYHDMSALVGLYVEVVQ